MKTHVWRPLYVVLALVAIILVARMVYVPDDFGAQERGYTFGYHRLSNQQEWQAFPSKYAAPGYCNDCHGAKADALGRSGHAAIPCENCHGAALNHPEQPERLQVDRSRDLCIRCHAQLVTPSSGRSDIPGIDPGGHNVDFSCSDCHDPHNPSLEEM